MGTYKHQLSGKREELTSIPHDEISNSFNAQKAEADASALFGDFVFFADINIPTHSWSFSEFKRDIEFRICYGILNSACVSMPTKLLGVGKLKRLA